MSKAKQAEKAEETLPATAADNAGLGGLGDFTEADLVKATEGQEGVKGTATAEDIKDAMGNRKPRLERIEVKHHGVNEFRFPDGRDPVKGTEGFVGVVLAHTYHNSNFDKPFEDHEEGEQPRCWSNDGTNVAPEVDEPLNAGGCPTCPFNRDAQDKAAREAAFQNDNRTELCSNYLSLAVALPGQDIPLVLRLTASSFKNWSVYVQQLGTRGRFRPHEVVTRLKLRNVKKGGNENSVAEFELVGPLPEHLAKAFKVQSVNYRSLLRRDAELAGPTDEAQHAMGNAKAAAREAEQEEAAL